jgi:hypothetical protein
VGDVPSHRSATLHAVSGIAPSCQVSPHTVAVSCEWSAGLVQHCSRLPARLACVNGAAYPHVLQAEGPEKATRVGVNENQLKFLTET